MAVVVCVAVCVVVCVTVSVTFPAVVVMVVVTGGDVAVWVVVSILVVTVGGAIDVPTKYPARPITIMTTITPAVTAVDRALPLDDILLDMLFSLMKIGRY